MFKENCKIPYGEDSVSKKVYSLTSFLYEDSICNQNYYLCLVVTHLDINLKEFPFLANLTTIITLYLLSYDHYNVGLVKSGHI